MIPVYVLTNDNHLFLLHGFTTCFARFWPDQPVTIAGFQPPTNPLPEPFAFQSIGDENLPVQQWSDGLLRLLATIPEKHFVLMLEDYWLVNPVDTRAIQALFRFMRYAEHKYGDVLRVDLTSDRETLANHTDCGEWEGIPIIESLPGSPYQMSFQAAIWSRCVLARTLKPGWSPWESEIKGTERLNRMGAHAPHVYGTRMRPLDYQPVYRVKRDKLVTNRIPEDLLAALPDARKKHRAEQV